MDLLFLLIADYANTTPDDKINIMGIFRQIYARKFPTKHPQMFIVCQFRAGAAEYGRSFKFGVKLIDEDATRELVKLEADFVVPRPKTGGRQVTLNQLIRLVDVVFPVAGTYEFSVLIDNDIKGTLPIQVNEIPQNTTPSEPPSSAPLN